MYNYKHACNYKNSHFSITEFSKSATRATTNNVILENSIEPDLHVNNAYDSVIR